MSYGYIGFILRDPLGLRSETGVSQRTPYEVLGIDPGATEETLRQAFLNLVAN